jgi:hypothetical protein
MTVTACAPANEPKPPHLRRYALRSPQPTTQPPKLLGFPRGCLCLFQLLGIMRALRFLST